MTLPLFTKVDAAFDRAVCTRGQHGALVDGPPKIGEWCVNVEHRCARCGVLVSETSWTRTAWDAQSQKVRR